MEVHKILGPGFPEKIYEEALVFELDNRRIPYERQKPVEVFYKGKKLSEFKLDLVVDGKVIVELKAVCEVIDTYHAKLLSYLKATGLRLGILVNFGSKRLEYWRVVN